VRLLVTGGAGFIGSTLVDRLLAEGHHVDVLDDLSTGSLANLAEARAERTGRLTFHQVDLGEGHAVDLIAHRAPEVVFHLAGQPDVAASVARPAHDARAAVVGTVNVLEGARLGGTRKVVAAASAAIYGQVPPRDLPVKESQAAAPRSPLGVSAWAMIEYLRLYRRLHDVEFTALVLSNVYGPRQDPQRGAVVAALAAAVLAGEPCTIHGDGEQTRDFLYVDDCVDAFVRAAERGDGLVINVGTGLETSVNDLHAGMAAAAGIDVPPGLAAARPGDVARSALDPGRAAIQLGWAPWTPLAEGTERVLDWLRQREA